MNTSIFSRIVMTQMSRFALIAILLFFSFGAVSGAAEESTKTSGTGFVVSSDGYVATAFHVIANATSSTVIFTDNTGKQTVFPATVAAVDPANDLALLKIQTEGRQFRPAPIPINVQRQRIGDEVLVIGYPFLDALGLSAKMNKGMISGFVGDFLQLDAAVNPGVSGGPVFNQNGEVVAITTAKLAGYEVSNVGLCIPSSRLVRFMDSADVKNGAKSNGAVTPSQLFENVSPSVALIVSQTAKKPTMAIRQSPTSGSATMLQYKDGVIIAPNRQAAVAPDQVSKSSLSGGQTWLAPKAAPGQSPGDGKTTPLSPLQYIETVTAKAGVVASPRSACSPNGAVVESRLDNGGIIIGLEITFSRTTGVASITPLYAALSNGARTFVRGKTIGHPSITKTQILAKEGYALTGLKIVCDENESGCGGLQVQFSRADGARTLGNDSYVSRFVGRGEPQKAATFVANGGFFVGLTGVVDDSKKLLKSIGVIVAPGVE